MLLEPNEARVVMFFGKYKGTFYETGFWWINPFMGRKKISVRARNLNVEPIKVNDKNGNPVMIGLVLVWKSVRTRSTGPCSTSTPRRWAAPILRFRLRPV